jgi:hypothetical protein
VHIFWRNKRVEKKRFLTAELVKSVRDGKKCKRASIGYLGGVSQRWLSGFRSDNQLVRLRAAVEIKAFWERVDRKLVSLADEEKFDIWRLMEERIPPVTIQEYDDAVEKLEKVRRFVKGNTRSELEKLSRISVDEILACEELKNPQISSSEIRAALGV